MDREPLAKANVGLEVSAVATVMREAAAVVEEAVVAVETAETVAVI